LLPAYDATHRMVTSRYLLVHPATLLPCGEEKPWSLLPVRLMNPYAFVD